MAQLRFSVPYADEYHPKIWETAFITGIEGIPWLCEHDVREGKFNIGRQIDESGKLNIVWPTCTVGNVCLSTTSLRVGEHEYNLALELARGTVFRLKNQCSEWQRVGLRLPDAYFPLAEQCLTELLRGLTASGNDLQQFRHAQSAIESSIAAAFELSNAFSHQALEARRNAEGRLATLLGCRLDSSTSLQAIGGALKTAFNLVCVAADFGVVESSTGRDNFALFDQQIEWASSTDHKVCVGPLVDFRSGRLPEWMLLLDEGFDNVLSAASQYVEKAVARYRGRAHLWNCATGLNVPNKLGWTDEQCLRMAVSLIETVRHSDDRTPVLLTIDEPWSEYLRDHQEGISPLHFADALIRADLGLSGLALELNLDQWPGGSFPRDLLEVNRLIDRWSMLGLPLMIILTSPSIAANHQDQSKVSNWPMPILERYQETLGQTGSQTDIAPTRLGADQQSESIVRLLLSKPSVHAIVWNTLHDSDCTHSQSFSGLWNAEGKPKPILSSLAKLRKTCLH